jgi:hypothetical protein
LIVFEREEALFERRSTVGGLEEFTGKGKEAVGFGLAAHGAADRDVGHA